MRLSLAAGVLGWTLLSVPTSVLAGSLLARGRKALTAPETRAEVATPPLPEPAAA